MEDMNCWKPVDIGPFLLQLIPLVEVTLSFVIFKIRFHNNFIYSFIDLLYTKRLGFVTYKYYSHLHTQANI